MTNQSHTQQMNSCRQNIQAFLDRDLGHWAGLKAGCRQSDVVPWYSFAEGEGVAYYGTRNIEYAFRSLLYAGFREGAIFYFHHDQLRCIATEFWSFDQKECSDLLQQLGEPLHRLSFHWRHDVIENGEWVYPERGIAIGVIPATQLIAWVIVYPPCTLNSYKQKYYNAGLAREFPAPRD